MTFHCNFILKKHGLTHAYNFGKRCIFCHVRLSQKTRQTGHLEYKYREMFILVSALFNLYSE